MKKDEALTLWKHLTPNQPILPHMDVIPYKASGSKYGSCGIRIDGNPQFVKAVMSRLQDLIDGENHETRLGLAWNKVDGSGINKSLPNQVTDAECCYIRLHERGHEGKILSSIINRHFDERTARATS